MRHRVERHRLAVRRRWDDAEAGVVAGIKERVRAEGERPEILEGARVPEERREGERRGGEDESGGRREEKRDDRKDAAATAAEPALAGMTRSEQLLEPEIPPRPLPPIWCHAAIVLDATGV